MDTTVKSIISIQISIWNRLKKHKNRSALINKALEFYFDREEKLNKADQEYWMNVEQSLKSNDGEYVSINPKGEKISKELLEEKLWS